MEPTVKAWYMMHRQCILHEHEHVGATAAMVAPALTTSEEATSAMVAPALTTSEEATSAAEEDTTSYI
jgi:hypothetical protein